MTLRTKEKTNITIVSEFSRRSLGKLSTILTMMKRLVKQQLTNSINRSTINKIFNKVRQHLFADNLNLSEKENGEFELDESYFGATAKED